jgi:type I restriction enzyme, S subunit
MKLLKLKLDDLGKIGRGKSKHRPRDDKSLYVGEFPFVQTGDVKAANFYLNEYTQTYNEKGLAQSKLWKKGTLLITIAANIGDTAILGLDACFPDSIVGFQSYENVSDIRYVKYYLDYIKLELKAISAGTTQDNMSLEKLLSRNLYVHEYTNQVKIASILFSYDELIENNKQRIKLLEEIAEEIYKEWFVRLRFPGYENAEIVDGLPEGWVRKPIDSFVNIISGYAFKTESFDSEGIYKLVTIKNVQDGFFVKQTTDYIYELPKNLKEDCKLKDKDIILSLTGNIGRICMVYGENYVLNQRVAKLKPKQENYFEFVYLMFRSSFLRVTLENLSNGAAQQNLSPIEMAKLEFPFPTEDIINKFSELTKSFFDEIITLNKKNQLLLETRDLLLPRLISGKLSVAHLLEKEEVLGIH